MQHLLLQSVLDDVILLTSPTEDETMTYEQARFLTSTETAKMIRAALKKAFPNVKFSVRQNRGNAINVDWVDGPTQPMVDKLIGGFEGSGFDGSIDMAYGIDHWLLKDGSVTVARCAGTVGSKGCVEPVNTPMPEGAELVRFGNGYVFTSRNYTEKFMQQAHRRLVRKFGETYALSQVKVSDWSGHAFLQHVDQAFHVEQQARAEIARLMIA